MFFFIWIHDGTKLIFFPSMFAGHALTKIGHSFIGGACLHLGILYVSFSAFGTFVDVAVLHGGGIEGCSSRCVDTVRAVQDLVPNGKRRQ